MYEKSRLHKHIAGANHATLKGPRGGLYEVYTTDSTVTLIGHSSRRYPRWLTSKYPLGDVIATGGTTYVWYGATYQKKLTLVVTDDTGIRRFSATPEQVAVLRNTDSWRAELAGEKLFESLTGFNQHEFFCRGGRWHITEEGI